MQIVIPMSGFGERFRRAGYSVPKPLIEIEGKPLVAHVIDMFPGEEEFIFVCNQDHLDTPEYRMDEILHTYAPNGTVVGIAPHKLGPVHAVQQVADLLVPDEPVVVNYCDFTCYWDWNHFKSFVEASKCAGAIPAYRGFHPHSLGSTNYAYMREEGGWVQDIQEKQPYTDNRMAEYASSGTYYFASAELMKTAMRETVTQGLTVGGEFYISLVYKVLLAEDEPVAVYPLQHFMQWGTPEDVAEYNMWSNAFRSLAKPVIETTESVGTLILPMAGLGQRFVDAGYEVPKPLIPVSGQPMVAQAANDLPPTDHQVFVLRDDMPGFEDVSAELKSRYPNSMVEVLDGVTEGQACTARIGLEAAEREFGNVAEPVTIAACDNGALYDNEAFAALLTEDEVDIVVWAVRGYANAARRPEMFGWIEVDTDGWINSISVKKPLDDPSRDPIVLGTFTFRRVSDFLRAADRLIARDGRVNGEFYIDDCINDAIELGLRCRVFEVDSYLCWGTPNDLRTFEYWQSCFDKWLGSPYRLELDGRVPEVEIPALRKRYASTVPVLPGPLND